jgi:hypothetical protein
MYARLMINNKSKEWQLATKRLTFNPGSGSALTKNAESGIRIRVRIRIETNADPQDWSILSKMCSVTMQG